MLFALRIVGIIRHELSETTTRDIVDVLCSRPSAGLSINYEEASNVVMRSL